jgi:hypothetical protein|tara:strand:+ start:1600 stop:2055 length:456 start_codon:yes stop_codon:yes gene_type:complete
MAYFAKLSDQNKVLQVLAVENKHMGDPEDEAVGQANLESIHGWPANMWKQCSYNTRQGKYWDQNENNERVLADDQSKALRGNYPGIGWTYDPVKDKFYGPQAYGGWVLNETTWCWDSPIPRPDDGNMYVWNESTTSWDGPYTAANNPYGNL